MAYQWRRALASSLRTRGSGVRISPGAPIIRFRSSYLVDPQSACGASKPGGCGTFNYLVFSQVLGSVATQIAKRFRCSKTVVSIGHVVTDQVSAIASDEHSRFNRCSHGATNENHSAGRRRRSAGSSMSLNVAATCSDHCKASTC
jgi:hypothetical protein